MALNCFIEYESSEKVSQPTEGLKPTRELCNPNNSTKNKQHVVKNEKRPLRTLSVPASERDSYLMIIFPYVEFLYREGDFQREGTKNGM